MILTDWLSWWYGSGVAELKLRLKFLFVSLLNTFSVPVLLSTLFDPWRRDEMKVSGAPINVELHAVWMNIISRLIGAVIRATTLLTAGLLLLIAALVGALALLLWLGWPMFVLICLWQVVRHA